MSDVGGDDLQRMRNSVFFEGPHLPARLSRFWILLVLASIIATAGVIADSTATVIGAMIVAPLMTPILGTTLALVLGDRVNLVRSLLLVVSGACTAIAIGFLLGLFIVGDVIAATNSQVAGRVNPSVVDLVAALATGVVGSVALARPDISDTLPGVAIAISLVPPLTVVGLTAESGAWDQSGGALLLFATNVAAILVSGLVVMAVYQVRRGSPSVDDRPMSRTRAGIAVGVFLLVVCIPLVTSTIQLAEDARRERTVRTVVEEWSEPLGWSVLSISSSATQTDVLVAGLATVSDLSALAGALTAAGIDPGTVMLEWLPRAPVSAVGAGQVNEVAP